MEASPTVFPMPQDSDYSCPISQQSVTVVLDIYTRTGCVSVLTSLLAEFICESDAIEVCTRRNLTPLIETESAIYMRTDSIKHTPQPTHEKLHRLSVRPQQAATFPQQHLRQPLRH